MDIHNQANQAFLSSCGPLSANPGPQQYFSKPDFKNAAIVSPDVGRASMAGKYAEC